MSEKKNALHEWIPVKESLPPKDEGCRCYVTMKKIEVSFKFTTELQWSCGEWFWLNGKPVADYWEIIAWQKRWYPEPYQGE